uniref:Uncharacterized protein n=1 Tax=Oryza meridionalis TaxID=40149 RepID=A0A0E0ED80_9ORYZ
MAAAAAVWYSAIAAVLLAATTVAVVVAAKMTGKRNDGAAAAELPLPPVVSVSLIIPVITRGPRAVADELYVKLGSVFTVSFLGVVKATFLVGPEVQGGFYSRPESEVHQGGTYRMTVPMFGRGVMYDVDVATRSEQIAVCFEALRPTKLRSSTVTIWFVKLSCEYFAKWGEQGTVDLKRELDLLILTIASRVLLGKEVRETMFNDVVSSFHELMDNSMHLISLCFPNLPIPRHRRRDTASARLKELFSRAIQLRRGSGRAEDDVLQCFLESKYRDGRAMSDNEITGAACSSPCASTWTGAFLLRNPKHLAAAVDEQRRLIGDRVDYDALTTWMSTLHRCIKEALRMHPPAPALIRTVRRGFAVRTREGKEYRVPAGHSVVLYAGFNHRLGYVYRDPDEYDPERFGPERKEDKVAGKFSFTAFGGGRHACLGEHYAFLKMKVIWSYLLRNFELELVSRFPEVELNNIMLGPRGEVMVSYKRRKLTSTYKRENIVIVVAQRVRFLHRKVTFLVGPEESSHFFTGLDSEISQDEVSQFIIPTFCSGVTFDVDYATRQEQFRFFGDAMKPAKLRSYVSLMVHEVEVRSTMLGEVPTLLRELNDSMRLITIVFPYLPILVHRRRDRARARLGKIFAEIVRSRRSSPGGGGTGHDDMLQCLIDARYKGSRATMEAEVAGMLVSALHTSSSTNTWASARLLTHPVHLRAAVREQEELVLLRHRHGGDVVDHNALERMGHLHRCVKETLRLHPPSLMLLRHARRSFVVRARGAAAPSTRSQQGTRWRARW